LFNKIHAINAYNFLNLNFVYQNLEWQFVPKKLICQTVSTINPEVLTMKTENARLECFEKHLDDEALFARIKNFFNYLFKGTQEKPFEKRCFIVVARKGFALWVAGMTCGLMEKIIPNHDSVLISDRCWRKMSDDEREKFIKGKHVFIADDSVRLGTTAGDIYKTVTKFGIAETIEIVVLTSENIDYSDKFPSYKDSPSFKNFGPDTTPDRRKINNKIMYAMYMLGVPFTSESPVFQLDYTDERFEQFKQSGQSNTGWDFEVSKLHFDVGTAIDMYFLKAPLSDEYKPNLKARGMRVFISENNEGSKIFVFIPWIAFCVLDYDRAIKYLMQYSVKDSWLYTQLKLNDDESETRKKTIVHRVMSYLLHVQTAKEFEDSYGDLKQYGEIDWGKYHFADELRKDIETLIKTVFENENDYPSKILIIEESEYKTLSNEITDEKHKTLLAEEFVCGDPHTFLELQSEMCLQRELIVEKNWRVRRPDIKRLPLLSCIIEGNELKLLDCYRKAVLSFRSMVFTAFNSRRYLLTIMAAGEGSHSILSQHNPFIYALHRYYRNPKNMMNLNEFACEWDKQKHTPDFKYEGSCILNVLQQISAAGWPREKDILEACENDNDVLCGVNDIVNRIIKSTDIVQNV
jgi:hypothetical protein